MPLRMVSFLISSARVCSLPLFKQESTGVHVVLVDSSGVIGIQELNWIFAGYNGKLVEVLVVPFARTARHGLEIAIVI
jgi:hypothetical protein